LLQRCGPPDCNYFLVVLTFLVSTAFDVHGNQLQAEPVTPEATSYRADSGDDQTSIKQERIKENVEKSAKILADEGVIKNKAVSTQELVKSI